MCITEFPEVCLIRICEFLEPSEVDNFKGTHFLIFEPIQHHIDDWIYLNKYPSPGLEAKADIVWLIFLYLDLVSAKELYCASKLFRKRIREKLDFVSRQIGFDRVEFDHGKDHAAFHYYGIN